MSFAAKYQTKPSDRNRFAAFRDDEPARPSLPPRAALPPIRGGYSSWKKQEDKKPETQAKKLEMTENNFPTLGAPSRINVTITAPSTKSLADRLKDAMTQEEETANRRRAGLWTEPDYEQPKEEMISLPLRRGKLTLTSVDYPDMNITAAARLPVPKTRSGLHSGRRPSFEIDAERKEELRLAWQSSTEMDPSHFEMDEDVESLPDETMDAAPEDEMDAADETHDS